jgi:hypothetical protein
LVSRGSAEISTPLDILKIVQIFFKYFLKYRESLQQHPIESYFDIRSLELLTHKLTVTYRKMGFSLQRLYKKT